MRPDEGVHPPSFDYAGTPLSVGQAVAFVAADTDRFGKHRLYDGTVVYIGEGQLVVESGNLCIMQGRRLAVGADEMEYVGVRVALSPEERKSSNRNQDRPDVATDRSDPPRG